MKAMERHVKPLVEALRSESEDAQRYAVETLVRNGESALKPFVDALLNEDAEVWDQAMEVLTNVGQMAIKPLLDVLSEKDRDVNQRILAVMVMGNVGDPSVIPTLIHALADESADVSGAAAFALENIGEPAVMPLIEALQSKPPRSKLRGIVSGKFSMGAAAPKPPLAIPPHSKLWGILANPVN
jgi:HEAT repeat protein